MCIRDSTRYYAANVYSPKVNSARSAYTNAFECEPRDFATGGISDLERRADSR